MTDSRESGNLAAARQRRGPSLSPPSAPVLSTVCGGELERGPPHPPINAPAPPIRHCFGVLSPRLRDLCITVWAFETPRPNRFVVRQAHHGLAWNGGERRGATPLCRGRGGVPHNITGGWVGRITPTRQLGLRTGLADQGELEKGSRKEPRHDTCPFPNALERLTIQCRNIVTSRPQYPNHRRRTLSPPSLCGRSARGEGGAGRRCKNIKILEPGSSEAQEADHGHETTLQNPRLTPRFSGTFTPGQQGNRELFHS